MTKAQELLKAKHGTPEAFERACWDACNDLFITTDECVAAVEKYRREWATAGAPDAESNRRDRTTNPARDMLARDKPVQFHKPGRCYVCGCKVYRTETVCGECACESDGECY